MGFDDLTDAMAHEAWKMDNGFGGLPGQLEMAEDEDDSGYEDDFYSEPKRRKKNIDDLDVGFVYSDYDLEDDEDDDDDGINYDPFAGDNTCYY